MSISNRPDSRGATPSAARSAPLAALATHPGRVGQGLVRAFVLVSALVGATGSLGCSTVRGSAIATGPSRPAYSGPVSIYAANDVPANAVDLGVVEVSAAQSESTISTLLPVFVQKVAQIGGNIAKVDAVRAHFELVTRTHLETYYYPCGQRAQCAGQRLYTTNDEVVVVTMLGHAYSDAGVPAPRVVPAEPPPDPSAPPPLPAPVPEPVPLAPAPQAPPSAIAPPSPPPPIPPAPTATPAFQGGTSL